MGLAAMRNQARAVFDAGVVAADPYQAVVKALNAEPMQAAGEGGKTLVLAVGKAATRMAQAAVERVCGTADEIGRAHV